MIKTNLNKNWNLKHDIGTMMTTFFGQNDGTEIVDLPHDEMRGLPRSADAFSGPNMAFFHGENIEYEKKIFIETKERSQVHYLNFDGIYMNATVKINGVFAAKHRSGYTPLTVRIDEYLRYGTENSISVQIRGNALPNARWYPGEGIYRDAFLLRGNALHILNDGIHVTTEDCDSGTAALMIEISVRNAGACSRETYAEVEILDPEGNCAAKRKAKFYVKADGEVKVLERVTLENPCLWNVDTPDLYTCVCRLVEDRETVDQSEAVFGIRRLLLDRVHGLRINGESVKLKGGCVHHDHGVLGSVSYSDAEVRRVKLLKDAGYNAIRTSHNPPSSAFLDACDRIGMLVMDEYTDVWTDTKALYDYGDYMPETWEADVEDMVQRDYNHPSVILWSIGNEIPETGNTIATQWGRKLVARFKELDSSRFVTNSINVMVSCMGHMEELFGEKRGDNQDPGGLNDLLSGVSGVNLMDVFDKSDAADPYIEESCDMLDLIGYNYTTFRYEREHALHPEWIFFGSETYPAKLDENWAVVTRNPYVIGDFAWTAWDYLGEVGCGRIEVKRDKIDFNGRYPWLAASDGDFDLTGYRRPMSYWRQIVWGGRHQPYLAVHRMQNYGKDLYISSWALSDAVHCWTWPGYEGKKTAVEVYSDAEEVELFINGRSAGRKKVGEESRQFFCKWEVIYKPGTIKAVAYKNGEKTGEDLLQTAGASSIILTADKKILRAGTDDLCYMEIELRDTKGILDMTADAEAALEVLGPVSLAGFGSANPCTEEKYSDLTHRFYEGRLLAVFKAGFEKGSAAIRVISPQKGTAEMKLTIE